MASRLNPYISFGDTARSAMEYYHEVFGGVLHLSTFGEMGTPADSPTPTRSCTGCSRPCAASPSWAPTPRPAWTARPGDTVAISLSGDDADDLRRYWEKLSDGGQVTVPLEKQMWGDEFGMCIDRFGVSWMVDIGQPQA